MGRVWHSGQDVLLLLLPLDYFAWFQRAAPAATRALKDGSLSCSPSAAFGGVRGTLFVVVRFIEYCYHSVLSESTLGVYNALATLTRRN